MHKSTDQRPSTNRDTSIIPDTMVVIGLVLATLCVVGLTFIARQMLMIVFGAILFGVVINQLAQLIKKFVPWDWKHGYRVGIIFLILVALIALGGFGFTQSINDHFVKLSDRIDESATRVIEAAKQQPVVERIREEVELGNVLPSSGKSLGLVQTLFSSTFGTLTDILILIILTAYFSVSPTVYRSGLLRIMPVRWRSRASRLFSESSDTLCRWMLGRLVSMAIVGICFGFGLALLGVAMPVELGIFAGLVTFVPNIGGIAAVVPALLLASNQGSSTVIAVLVVYVVIQFTESYFITPLVQQKQVNLPPAMVILAQVICGLLFGIWGIMFATPLVAVTLLFIRRLYVEEYLEVPQS